MCVTNMLHLLSILAFCSLSISSYHNITSECGFMDSWVPLHQQEIQPGDLENVVTATLSRFQTSEVTESHHSVKANLNLKRHRRFAHYKTKWEKQELTFRVSRYPDKGGLVWSAVDEVVEQVFATWAEKTNLVFQPVAEHADISIQFVNGNQTKFKNGTIFGVAEIPPKGIVYMNEDWMWSIRNKSGKDLFKGLLHEVGHAVGLQHSNVSGSIMQPQIKLDYNPDFTLHDDDVRGIQALYGNRTKLPPDLCLNSSFDAIFEYLGGVIYILKGDYYWKLTPDGIASRYPRLISHRWPGVPGNVDAATATSLGETYFFKGNKFWKFHHTTPCNSNPMYISMGWPGMPHNVDAVTWRGHFLFYFFKGDMYWQYDAELDHMSDSSPRSVTDWGGMTGHLNDVLYASGGYIYFFTGELYFRYNCKIDLIDYDPEYPRPTGPWWFHCE